MPESTSSQRISTPRFSRRNFVACVAGSLCATGLVAGAPNDDPPANFPTNSRERLSVTSYPFRSLIESPTNKERKRDVPGFDLTEFAAFVADKLGVHNINPLIGHFRSTEPAYFEAFRNSLLAARSHIVDLGLPGKPFYSSDREIRQSAVTSGKSWIDMAKAVGSPSVRQHISGAHGERPNLEWAGESLGQLAEYGGKHNVVVNLENDSPISEDPFFLVQVIETVRNPYLRALPDIGNSLIGHDAEYNRKAVSAMFKHVFNMSHVKDKVTTDAGKLQTVDLDGMFRIAKDSGYRGYFSMEFDTGSGDPLVGTQHLIDETLKYLGEENSNGR
jgi:sugar phosphate isomerase/epimerase